jgi:hypothetical protein
MWELRALELVIALFLALPLIRPFVRSLWPVAGLDLLPALAAGISIGLYPAYGIRPECFPLILYTLILNIMHFPALVSVLGRLQNDDFRNRGPVELGISLGLIFATVGIALWFAPVSGTDLRSQGVNALTIRDEGRDRALYLRIYGPAEPETGGGETGRPLMVLIPPAVGSLLAVDRICGELADQGFTVLSYSRQGIDAPAIRETGKGQWLPPSQTFRLLRVFFRGTKSAAANVLGRSLEEERKRDILFLLSAVRGNVGIGNALPAGTDRGCIFIAGYGAGGAALISLSSAPGFTVRYPAVRGIIALESPLLSVLRQEPRKTLDITREEAGWLRFFLADVSTRLANMKPKKINGMDTLPQPEIPALYILCDRILYTRNRGNRYATILESFRTSRNVAVLAAVPGAGPLDYSGIPEKYPLLKRFFPGELPPVWSRKDYAPGTAALITNFSAALLGDGSLQRTILDRNIYIGINGAWNFTTGEYILGL